MAEGPLARVVVVDCTEGVAGGYASYLLAVLGARVIKVEPPGGERLRALGPFPGDVPDGEVGGLRPFDELDLEILTNHLPPQFLLCLHFLRF